MAERILVLGGARSGKSAVAERLVRGAATVVYVATGGSGDAELAERVTVHRARRPAGWSTVETRDVDGAVGAAAPGSAVLVDALGPWLLDRMTGHDLWAPDGAAIAPLGREGRAAAAAVVAEARGFWAAAAAHRGGPVVLVADESGWGLTPPDPSSRRWLDLAGDVVAALAAEADRVLLVVAGRVVPLAPPDTVPAGAVCAAAADGRLGGERTATAFGVDLAAHGDRMVPAGALDFAVNVHGDGPPPHLRAVLAAALDDLGRYPDDSAARAAAARRHDRDPGEVVVTAGAAEAFRLLATVLRPSHAAVVHPQFTEPEAALRATGTPVTRVPRDAGRAWALDPDAVPDAADLVVLGNPNNPTGTLDPPASVAALCRPGRTVVVDEAFLDFVVDERAAGLAHRGELPGLVVVRSVTKLWGLPGLRAGYLVGPRGLCDRLQGARQPWPVSGPALAAVAACCADDPHRVAVATAVARARAELAERLAALPGVRVWPSAANFLLLRVPDGAAVEAALRQRGVAVRPSTFPGLDADHLRVAVHDPARNAQLLAAFAEVLRDGAPRSSQPGGTRAQPPSEDTP